MNIYIYHKETVKVLQKQHIIKFFTLSADIWEHLSETLAPLHPIINLFFIFNKLYRVQYRVQYGCKWVQAGCKDRDIKRTCTQKLTLKINRFVLKGARVHS